MNERMGRASCTLTRGAGSLSAARLLSRFARLTVAYLECGNAKAAARAAGYSESYARSRGYKLLEHPSVMRALESGVGRSDGSDRSDVVDLGTDLPIRQGTDRSTHLSTEGVVGSELKSAVKSDSEVGGVHLSVGALPQEKRCGLPRKERRKLELARRREAKKAARKTSR